jgi:2-polyprenyl-3-methyl-5-hydroxy-6-metoxy-1,4-benzoquinol methylase
MLLFLDNYLYTAISKFVVKLENGIHPKHRLMKYHDFFLDNINSTDIVLDIGCGNGFNTHFIAEKAKKVIGIDINEENIAYAKRNFLSDNIDYFSANIMDYKFNQKFDVIVLSNVLEHIEDRIKLLKKIKNMGKRFLIRVPMINRSWMVLYKKELGMEYRLDKTHLIEYTIDSFIEELGESELEIVSYSVQFGEIWAIVKK